MIGKMISHYRILEHLGGGGMGVVYKALDTELQRLVALKFLPPEFSRDPESKKRFVHEAQAASALEHNNICTIHEIGQTDDGQLFICMTLYEGETLKKKIERGALMLDDALHIAILVARGLARAHEAGMIHRDVKPANIIVTERNEIKIVDFGLAKLVGQTRLTKEGTTMGTVAYMSPEQARGESVDQRSDIWSLGITLYEMLSGRPPFKGDYEQAVIYSILNEEPPAMMGIREKIPMELERTVRKAIAKNTEERYQHVSEILDDLLSVQKELESRKIEERLPRPPLLKNKKLLITTGIAALIVFSLVLLYMLIPPKQASIDRKSIAVLPFTDMSPQKNQEYFCDGMTEELINALTRLKGLHVAARTSAFRFKGRSEDIRKIGEQLNVSTILEGSVRKAANTLRITAQLINVEDGYHLWSETYERQLKDVFAVQEDISRSIVNALKIRLIGQEETSIVKRYTGDLEAYNLYLKGRYYWNKRTEEGLKKSLEYFQQAIEKDPLYPLAYAGLADAYIVLVDWGFLSPETAHPRAKAAASRALEIDSTLAEARTSLAYIQYIYDWDWQSAEKEYKRAIELNPKYATAHQWYAEYLTAMGRFEEAIAQIKRAQELDPLSLIINAIEGWIYFYAGQYDRVIEQCLKTLEMDPNFYPAHLYLQWTYEQKGMYEETITEIRKMMIIQETNAEEVAALDSTFAHEGMQGVYLLQINKLKREAQQKYVPPTEFARIYAALGNKDRALEWLEKAYENRGPGSVYLKVDPSWDVLRSESRFTALLKKVGFEN